MKRDGSVSHWIQEIKGGNRDAAQDLWERYYRQLVNLARKRFSGSSTRVSDEEDVVSEVFEKFFRFAESGRFPDLSDRDGLWRLLVRMTADKVIDHQRKAARQRRGGGMVRGESVFLSNPNDPEMNAIAQVIGDEPTPEFAAAMTEQVSRMLSMLNEPGLIQLAIGKMQGYDNAELAQQQ